MKRSFQISLRIPFEMGDKLEKYSSEKNYPNSSEAIRTLIERGLWIESMEQKIKDESFLNEMNEKLANEKILDWTKSLTDTQLDGLSQAARWEKENRAKVMITSR